MSWHQGRGLTTGEYHLLQPIFRHALDYGRVRVMARRYAPFQAALVAMSPNGNMFFPRGSLYCDDFSCVSPQRAALFIHEAVHVWQHQMGCCVRLCGLCLALQGGYIKARAYSYRHLLKQKNQLNQFNIEQQAVIITDFFTASTPPPELEALMSDFLRNPADKKLLPRSWGMN